MRGDSNTVQLYCTGFIVLGDTGKRRTSFCGIGVLIIGVLIYTHTRVLLVRIP